MKEMFAMCTTVHFSRGAMRLLPAHDDFPSHLSRPGRQSMDVFYSSTLPNKDIDDRKPRTNDCSKSARQCRGGRLRRVAFSVLLLASRAASRCCAFFIVDSSSRKRDMKNHYSTPLGTSQEASEPTNCFPDHRRPYLAVITEPDACDCQDRMSTTIDAISSAVSTGKVSLVSVRIVQPENVTNSETFEHLVVELTRRLVALSEEHSFRVVVTSDWVSAAIRACAHGIHVKEKDRSTIPDIRKEFAPRVPLIGTSAHSVASALEAASLFQPDYLFVGTCFSTASHPEKGELEGPALPGTVCRALSGQTARPVVLAIGGIDEHNCRVPVAVHGADGVAVIRSVLRSFDPRGTAELIQRNMRENFVAEGK